ncbi:MAG: hypothetical protein IKO59_01170 [Bacteroidales bacterium]|nr:hypothetical protein [Bacteroidales bacterium]
MNLKITILGVFLMFCSMILLGQRYYGQNGYGMLEIIDDTTAIVSFTEKLGVDFTFHQKEKCLIRRVNDTLFLSTFERWKYVGHVDSAICYDKNQCFPILYKLFYYNHKYKKYDILHEGVGWDDLSTGDIYIQDADLFPGDYMIIIKKYNKYERIALSCLVNFDNPAILISTNQKFHGDLIFDEFPLLIKGNKLIPINYNKRIQCWKENGFVFPIMKKQKKLKSYKTYLYYYTRYDESLCTQSIMIPNALKNIMVP